MGLAEMKIQVKEKVEVYVQWFGSICLTKKKGGGGRCDI